MLLSAKRFANPCCAKRLKSQLRLHIMHAFKPLRRRKSRRFLKACVCVKRITLEEKASTTLKTFLRLHNGNLSRVGWCARRGRLSYFPSAGAAANRFAYHGSIGATKRQRRLLQYSVPMGAHTHCTAPEAKRKKNTNTQARFLSYMTSSYFAVRFFIDS